MIVQDGNNKYASLLIKTKDIISKTKKLGIDTTNIEERISNIEKEVDKEISKIITQTNNPLKEGALNNTYLDGINKLKKIQAYLLSEFDEYSKIYTKYQYMTTNFDNLDINNIDTYLKETRLILSDLKNLSNMDHKMKKTLTENIYLLVYQVIKKEYQIAGKSTLLPLLTDIDIPYIEKCLLEEINELSPDSNQEIFNLIQKIEMEGLNPNYLKEDIFKLLIYNTENLEIEHNPELKNKIIEVQEDIQYYNELTDMAKAKLYETQNNIKKIQLSLVRYCSYLVIATIAGFFVSKNASKEKNYYTIEETYQLGEEPIISDPYYEPSSEDKITITKYYPYEKLGSWDIVSRDEEGKKFKFFREVKVYDVSEIEFANFEDYLTLNLEELGIENDESEEYKVYLTPQDTYSDIITKVKRTIHDLENFKMKQDIGGFFLNFIIYFNIEIGMFKFILPYKKFKKIKAEYEKYENKKNSLENRIITRKDQIKSLEEELEKLQTSYISTSSKQLVKKKL